MGFDIQRKRGNHRKNMENKEIQEHADLRKNNYIVHIRRDKDMMLTFVKFSNRVKHPRVSFNMLCMGALLLALPTVAQGGIALPGVVISYVMGGILVLMALFRQYISVSMMRGNPEVKENEELTYFFGNSGVRVEQDGAVESMGYYKSVYRVWEDEKHYYVGMNDDDLLILPKVNFTEGTPREFRDFILEKSGAEYIWMPAGLVNRVRNKWMNFQMKLTLGMPEENKK